MTELEIAILKIMYKNSSLSYQGLDHKVILSIGLHDSNGDSTVGKNLSLAVRKLVSENMLFLSGQNEQSISITEQGNVIANTI